MSSSRYHSSQIQPYLNQNHHAILVLTTIIPDMSIPTNKTSRKPNSKPDTFSLWTMSHLCTQESVFKRANQITKWFPSWNSIHAERRPTECRPTECRPTIFRMLDPTWKTLFYFLKWRLEVFIFTPLMEYFLGSYFQVINVSKLFTIKQIILKINFYTFNLKEISRCLRLIT